MTDKKEDEDKREKEANRFLYGDGDLIIEHDPRKDKKPKPAKKDDDKS